VTQHVALSNNWRPSVWRATWIGQAYFSARRFPLVPMKAHRQRIDLLVVAYRILSVLERWVEDEKCVHNPGVHMQ
jgi:hypothetical protein